MGTPGPLQRERNIRIAVGLRLQASDVVEPRRVDSQALKRVRLSQAEGEEGGDRADDQIKCDPRPIVDGRVRVAGIHVPPV